MIPIQGRGEGNHLILFRLAIRVEAIKSKDTVKIVQVHLDQDLDLEVKTGIEEQDGK